MNPDLAYAIDQLRPLMLNRVQASLPFVVRDRIQRAFDALERMEAKEKRDPEADKRTDAAIMGRIARL